jgi:hypothetical protein
MNKLIYYLYFLLFYPLLNLFLDNNRNNFYRSVFLFIIDIYKKFIKTYFVKHAYKYFYKFSFIYQVYSHLSFCQSMAYLFLLFLYSYILYSPKHFTDAVLRLVFLFFGLIILSLVFLHELSFSMLNIGYESNAFLLYSNNYYC